MKKGKHGGKRAGAGKPKGITTKIVERQSQAEGMLDKLGGDAEWVWCYEAAKKNRDYHAAADILRYWTDRAKGKAPQSVKLEAETNVQFVFGDHSRSIGNQDQ